MKRRAGVYWGAEMHVLRQAHTAEGSGILL